MADRRLLEIAAVAKLLERLEAMSDAEVERLRFIDVTVDAVIVVPPGTVGQREQWLRVTPEPVAAAVANCAFGSISRVSEALQNAVAGRPWLPRNEAGPVIAGTPHSWADGQNIQLSWVQDPVDPNARVSRNIVAEEPPRPKARRRAPPPSTEPAPKSVWELISDD